MCLETSEKSNAARNCRRTRFVRWCQFDLRQREGTRMMGDVHRARLIAVRDARITLCVGACSVAINVRLWITCWYYFSPNDFSLISNNFKSCRQYILIWFDGNRNWWGNWKGKEKWIGKLIVLYFLEKSLLYKLCIIFLYKFIIFFTKG